MLVAAADLTGYGQVLIGVGTILTPVGVLINMEMIRRGKNHAKEGKLQATEANDAVNNVHSKQDPRLRDLVLDQQKMIEQGFMRASQRDRHLKDQIQGLNEEMGGVKDQLIESRGYVMKMWAKVFHHHGYDEVDVTGELIE
ncbi:MAG: hypothetical protein GY701_07070 [Sulfitobacter sp.]|nr:hypothetical protein [Sulfitobacter sp.]